MQRYKLSSLKPFAKLVSYIWAPVQLCSETMKPHSSFLSQCKINILVMGDKHRGNNDTSVLVSGAWHYCKVLLEFHRELVCLLSMPCSNRERECLCVDTAIEEEWKIWYKPGKWGEKRGERDSTRDRKQYRIKREGRGLIIIGVGTVWFIPLSVIILLYEEFKLICIVCCLIRNNARGLCEHSHCMLISSHFYHTQCQIVWFLFSIFFSSMSVYQW